MNKKLRLGCYLVVALAQVAVPATMIWGHERALTQGAVYIFRTQPVDPYDAFRGRYVRLRIEEDHAPLMSGMQIQPGQKVYALIEIGTNGFAKFSGVRTSPPSKEPYLTARARYADGTVVHLDLPFDRYYMEESLAPAAEKAYRENSHRGIQKACVSVRVLDGTGVLENLWIDDVSIHKFVSGK
jgi:uncharacterized membrane-anchored protein